MFPAARAAVCYLWKLCFFQRTVCPQAARTTRANVTAKDIVHLTGRRLRAVFLMHSLMHSERFLSPTLHFLIYIHHSILTASRLVFPSRHSSGAICIILVLVNSFRALQCRHLLPKPQTRFFFFHRVCRVAVHPLERFLCVTPPLFPRVLPCPARALSWQSAFPLPRKARDVRLTVTLRRRCRRRGGVCHKQTRRS